jgi:hypothetical protein
MSRDISQGLSPEMYNFSCFVFEKIRYRDILLFTCFKELLLILQTHTLTLFKTPFNGGLYHESISKKVLKAACDTVIMLANDKRENS